MGMNIKLKARALPSTDTVKKHREQNVGENFSGQIVNIN